MIIDRNSNFSNKIEIIGDSHVICSDNLNPEYINKISIFGDNNLIIIGNNVKPNLLMCIGDKNRQLSNNNIIIISDSVTFNFSNRMSKIIMYESNSIVLIGSDCMFAGGIEIWATDGHSICDLSSGKLLNKGKFVFIGPHVWLARNVQINKNSFIPSGSVVGLNSLVTGKFFQGKSVLAGSPCKIVKSNITWLRQNPDQFLNSSNDIKLYKSSIFDSSCSRFIKNEERALLLSALEKRTNYLLNEYSNMRMEQSIISEFMIQQYIVTYALKYFDLRG